MFRYYNSNTGTYISQDPIGLEGSDRFYAYIKDPNTEADIFGLKCFKNTPKKKVNSAEVGDLVRTPSEFSNDFIKSGKNYTNSHTKEIWQKSNTNHSG